MSLERYKQVSISVTLGKREETYTATSGTELAELLTTEATRFDNGAELLGVSNPTVGVVSACAFGALISNDRPFLGGAVALAAGGFIAVCEAKRRRWRRNTRVLLNAAHAVEGKLGRY